MILYRLTSKILTSTKLTREKQLLNSFKQDLSSKEKGWKRRPWVSISKNSGKILDEESTPWREEIKSSRLIELLWTSN